MTTIFYLVALNFLWLEILWIMEPIQQTERAKNFFDLSTLNKGSKKWDDYTPEYKEAIKSSVWRVPSVAWLFAGLFTAQWFSFLLIIALNLLVVSWISRLTRYSIAYTVLHWLNSVIGAAFALFIIINHYHLHIDTYALFRQYIA